MIAPGESEATTTCVPDNYGGTNFSPPSYDPERQLFFVMTRETCAIYLPVKQEPVPGRLYIGGTLKRISTPETEYSAVRAIDVTTGNVRWEYKVGVPSMAGVTSTASGLVFAGSQEGNFNALDASTGKKLWSTNTGANIYGAAATTYMLDGRQIRIDSLRHQTHRIRDADELEKGQFSGSKDTWGIEKSENSKVHYS